MAEEQNAREAPHAAIWTAGADGSVVREPHGADLSETLGRAKLVIAVTPLDDGSAGLLRRYRQAVPESNSIEPRPLTGPFVVPDGWEGELGAQGYIAAEPEGRLVLVAWPAESPSALEPFVCALADRFANAKIRTAAEARRVLERPIPVLGSDGDEGALDLDYERALAACEAMVAGYEESFRSGRDFTRETHIRIEQMLHELVIRKGAFGTPSQETERLGLASRLVRLLDAQSMRDASGALGRVLSALTALVLVPTLVAGVFGANVPIPYADEPATRWIMFALMGCGGAVSYLVLTSVGQSAVTRRLEFRAPGGYDGDTDDDVAWRARFAFVTLTGAASGVAIAALVGVWASDAPGMRESTTGVAALLAALALLAIAGALIRLDVRERTWLHAVVLSAGAVGAGLAAVALLTSNVWLGAAGMAVVGASGWVAQRPTRRAALWGGTRAKP
jgi:hypothetical protein